VGKKNRGTFPFGPSPRVGGRQIKTGEKKRGMILT